MFKKFLSGVLFATMALLSVYPAEAALVWQDRTVQTTTTTGTTDFVLSGGLTGYQSWAGIGNGNTAYYVATDGTNWEVGLGTYSTVGPTLARTTVLSSSTGSKISFGAGTKSVSLTSPSSWLSVVATLADTQTLTNKTINCANNTCTVRAASDITGTLPVGNGGTNLTTYTTGDIVYATSTNVLGKLSASSTAGQVLTSNGTGVAPTYQTVSGGGWTQLCGGALSTASGNTVTCTSISSGYHQIICQILGVKNTTGSQTLSLSLSSSAGSSYGTAGVVISMINTSAYNGAIYVENVDSTITTTKMAHASITNGTDASIASVQTPTDTAAVVNQLKFVSSGTFNGGSADCYGVK